VPEALERLSASPTAIVSAWSCQHRRVQQSELQTLPVDDQHAFLLGRIGMQTVRMDIALRFLHSMLEGHRDFDAFLDAPDRFSANAKSCRRMIADHDALSPESRAALTQVVSRAEDLYAQRNRFTHDFLRTALIDQTRWELARVARTDHDLPDRVIVSFESMVEFVCALIAATYQLRASAMHVVGQGSGWDAGLFGTVVGRWDGAVDVTPPQRPGSRMPPHQ
jgi:hypothetical protein